MNDTTLPLKSKQRSKASGLRPGFGLHDWLTLLRHAKDLAQRRGAPLRRDISLHEVKQHNKPYDGWMVLRGKVYNIAPYLAYHPGGSEILEKCLGRDGTVLFDKYHSWVNIEGLIDPLLIGYLKIEKKSHEDEEGYLKGRAGANNGSSHIVLPSAAASTNAANSSSASNDNIEFEMPKPRPAKGSVVPSLLGANDNDNEEEEELI